MAQRSIDHLDADNRVFPTSRDQSPSTNLDHLEIDNRRRKNTDALV